MPASGLVGDISFKAVHLSLLDWVPENTLATAILRVFGGLTGLPFGPSSPGGPLAPAGPAAPGGPASPFSPLSPLGPYNWGSWGGHSLHQYSSAGDSIVLSLQWTERGMKTDVWTKAAERNGIQSWSQCVWQRTTTLDGQHCWCEMRLSSLKFGGIHILSLSGIVNLKCMWLNAVHVSCQFV